MTVDQQTFLECERKVPVFMEYSNAELLAEVGQLELGSGLLDPDTEVNFSVMVQAGDKLMKKRSLREIICDETNSSILKDLIETIVTPASVASVLAVLGPMVGVALPVAVVPGALIALAVLLMRLGLNEYCQS